jgi:hypothetical protein
VSTYLSACSIRLPRSFGNQKFLLYKNLVYAYIANTMVNERKKKGRPRGGICRFPGITVDAVTLGCTYTHLWKVLVGLRTSESLLARYRQLKEAQRLAAIAQPQPQRQLAEGQRLTAAHTTPQLQFASQCSP